MRDNARDLVTRFPADAEVRAHRRSAGRGDPRDHVVDDPTEVPPGHLGIEATAEGLQRQHAVRADEVDRLGHGDDAVRAPSFRRSSTVCARDRLAV